jgi:tRNA dimethylallyltransferase
MFKNTCIEEVKKFNTLKLNKSLSANKLIGVQEINSYLKGTITLDHCRELINVKTRQYAKRQNTWARGHMKNWNKLYSKDLSILLKKTLKVIS